MNSLTLLTVLLCTIFRLHLVRCHRELLRPTLFVTTVRAICGIVLLAYTILYMRCSARVGNDLMFLQRKAYSLFRDQLVLRKQIDWHHFLLILLRVADRFRDCGGS